MTDNAEREAPQSSLYVAHAPWSEEDDPQVWCIYWDHGNDKVNSGEALSVACYRTEAEAERDVQVMRQKESWWVEVYRSAKWFTGVDPSEFDGNKAQHNDGSAE